MNNLNSFLVAACLLTSGNFFSIDNDPMSRSEAEAKAKGMLSDMVQQFGSVFIKEAVEEVGETIQEVIEGKLGGSDKEKEKSGAVASGRVVWVAQNTHIMLNVDQANAFDNALQRNSELCARILEDAVVVDPAPFGYTGKSQGDYDKFIGKACAVKRFAR